MKKVIFVSLFGNINSDSNNRVLSIYNRIEGEKTVLSADFDHARKQYRGRDLNGNPDQIYLHVPAYRKNLSLRRVLSHIIFALRVKKYLYSLTAKPDVVYCAMPTSSAAYVCAKYCRRYGVRFVIDVIDLWPDSLLPIVKENVFIKSLLAPWSYITRYAYHFADFILGESILYANEAKKYNKNAPVHPIYLGVDMGYVNDLKRHSKVKLLKPEDEIWIGYAGSLGESYDFDTLLDAVQLIHGKHKYKLWFIGGGVKQSIIESKIKKKGLNAEITGNISYGLLLSYLSYCDIAVNIFKKGTKVVHSYKFNDYVAMSCFVLNSLVGETAEMVDGYKVGRNFNFTDNPLSVVLLDTFANWSHYSPWRAHSQRLVDEKLDKNKIYAEVDDAFL